MAVADTFDMEALRADLILDEGRRSRPYLDTATPPRVTIGIARNLTDNGLSDAEIEFLFANDIQTAKAGLDSRLPWWRSMPDFAQRVLINLTFNMGIAKLARFPHFLDALQRQDWAAARTELRSSLWYSQVGLRGPRMLQRLTPPVVG